MVLNGDVVNGVMKWWCYGVLVTFMGFNGKMTLYLQAIPQKAESEILTVTSLKHPLNRIISPEINNLQFLSHVSINP